MAVDCDLDGSEFIEMSRVNWDQSTSRPVRATCAAAGVSAARRGRVRGWLCRWAERAARRGRRWPARLVGRLGGVG